MKTVLGIDGGGTSTRVAIVTSDGAVLGIGTAGSGNLHDVGPEGLRENVGAAHAAAWSAVGREPERADAAFFGMASVVTPSDRATVKSIGQSLELAPAEAMEVDHDLRIALAGGLGGGAGIVFIAGTGSSCFGRNAAGETWMAGGWGSFLSDEGSAFDLGRRGLIACVRAHDGRGSRTVLSDVYRTKLGIAEWRELLYRIDADGLRRAEVAALAPLVTEAAAHGDAVAVDIVQAATDALSEAVETVARKIGERAPKIVPSGGLAHSGPAYRAPLERAVLRRIPYAQIVDPTLPPVLGAACLALELVDAAPDAAAMSALRGYVDRR
ncbi:MAG: ATPase [bacterium]|nr:ATPase [bacterium]